MKACVLVMKHEMLIVSVGEYVKQVVEMNPHTFRIFSPDELNSNKLDAAFEITHRNFQWDPEVSPAEAYLDEELIDVRLPTTEGGSSRCFRNTLCRDGCRATPSPGDTLYSPLTKGRCSRFVQQPILTSSFLGIVQTMIEVGVNARCMIDVQQYAKFVKMALETKWRGDVAGLTYIESR